MKEKNAQMFKAFMEVGSNPQGLQKFTPPCSEIEKIQVTQTTVATNAALETFWNITGLRGRLENVNGWFRIQVTFPKNTYREIKQIRAYSLQSLVGTAGGYVGLFVGYSISELPLLFVVSYNYIVDKIWGAQIPNRNELARAVNNL